MEQRLDRLDLEGYRILWPNFRGEKGTYNEAGVRGFSVLIDDLGQAKELLNMGWALKPLKNEEGNIDAYHLPVKVNYNSRQPPRIYKVSTVHKRAIPLDERTIDMLDLLPIESADIIINPYHWDVNDKTGIKAYVQVMYVVIEENHLDTKWAEYTAEPPPFEPDMV